MRHGMASITLSKSDWANLDSDKSKELRKMLQAGWEPYAVTQESSEFTHWLKKPFEDPKPDVPGLLELDAELAALGDSG